MQPNNNMIASLLMRGRGQPGQQPPGLLRDGTFPGQGPVASSAIQGAAAPPAQGMPPSIAGPQPGQGGAMPGMPGGGQLPQDPQQLQALLDMIQNRQGSPVNPSSPYGVM